MYIQERIHAQNIAWVTILAIIYLEFKRISLQENLPPPNLDDPIIECPQKPTGNFDTFINVIFRKGPASDTLHPHYQTYRAEVYDAKYKKKCAIGVISCCAQSQQ